MLRRSDGEQTWGVGKWENGEEPNRPNKGDERKTVKYVKVIYSSNIGK